MRTRGCPREAPAARTVGRPGGGASAAPCAGEDGQGGAGSAEASSGAGVSTVGAPDETTALPESFCIIESQDAVKDFASMQLEEISRNIQSRKNKVFLLLEEIRRLRIQERMKTPSAAAAPGGGNGSGTRGAAAPESELEAEEFRSALPYFPPITERTFDSYKAAFVVAVSGIMFFGGIVAPSLEVRLGLGGQSYREFIRSIHFPEQLAEVDPIVASFCGGAVGVLTSLMIVEANNIRVRKSERCVYCQGTGYLNCGACAGTGAVEDGAEPCAQCGRLGKVMCTSCLCTGKQMATEHDVRMEPFN
ncbi:unnamed protein product [Pedinophyceae sp. YPF-701]|nr:unnamed protein product [Pedinophyceae sp. YPF-701]